MRMIADANFALFVKGHQQTMKTWMKIGKCDISFGSSLFAIILKEFSVTLQSSQKTAEFGELTTSLFMGIAFEVCACRQRSNGEIRNPL